MDADNLPASKLGTKQHWDGVYATELANFKDIGDEGEIWFGEDSVEKMVNWVLTNAVPSSDPFILEVGSGNGFLLFSLLDAGYDPTRLYGIDYSEDAVNLAVAIGASKGGEAQKVRFSACDFLKEFPKPIGVEDVTQKTGVWDLVLDKGTFDAMALAQKEETGSHPADAYPTRIAQTLKTGGCFLIVSCNFTEDELIAKFSDSETGLVCHSRLKFPKYSFGGRSGTMYAGAAFNKMG